jgi:hypothetical protein
MSSMRIAGSQRGRSRRGRVRIRARACANPAVRRRSPSRSTACAASVVGARDACKRSAASREYARRIARKLLRFRDNFALLDARPPHDMPSERQGNEATRFEVLLTNLIGATSSAPPPPHRPPSLWSPSGSLLQTSAPPMLPQAEEGSQLADFALPSLRMGEGLRRMGCFEGCQRFQRKPALQFPSAFLRAYV